MPDHLDPFKELNDLMQSDSNEQAAPSKASFISSSLDTYDAGLRKFEASIKDNPTADTKRLTAELATENEMLIQRKVNTMLRESGEFDPGELKALSAVVARPLEMEQRERLAQRDDKQLLTVEINFISSGELQIDTEPPKPVMEVDTIEVIEQTEKTEADLPTTKFDFEALSLEVLNEKR